MAIHIDIDDTNFEIADKNLSNKSFPSNLNVRPYKKLRDKYILSVAEEQIIHKQVEIYKDIYLKKKNKLEKIKQTTKNYKASLIEFEIENHCSIKTNISSILEQKRKYAKLLRDNDCCICKSLIFGKPISIQKLSNGNIGNWIYKRNKSNIACQLDCKHIFHSHCITDWFEHKSNCPMCRERVNLWNPSIENDLQQPIFIISSNISDISDISDEISDEIYDLNSNYNQQEEEKQNNVNNYSNDMLLPGQIDENLD